MKPIEPRYGPHCPLCGGDMKLITPEEFVTVYDPFWGCEMYPDCSGKRNVDPGTGLPALTAEEEERELLRWIYEDRPKGIDI